MGCGASNLIIDPHDLILGRDVLGVASGWPHNRDRLVLLHKAKAFRHDQIVDDLGRTLGFYAACLDKPELLSFLRKKNANLKQPDKNGITPLMAACKVGAMQAVLLLLKKKRKARKNCATQDRADGRTPLHHAAVGNQELIMKLLIDRGKASLAVRDKHGMTPLMCACRVGAITTASFIIDKTNFEHWMTQDYQGNTALAHARMAKPVQMPEMAGVPGHTAKAQTDGKEVIVSRLEPKIWLHMAQQAQKDKRFGAAERLWVKLQRPADAVKMYMSAHKFVEAVRLAKNHLPDMVRTIRTKHAEFAQSKGHFMQAEQLWVQLGNPEKVVNMYISAKKFDEARRSALKHQPDMIVDVQLAKHKHLADIARREAEAARKAAEPSSSSSSGGDRGRSYAGPCVAGDCLVRMADGSEKLAQDLRRGDKVHAGGTVRCVVECMCRDGQRKLVSLGRNGGLRITTSHPVFVGGEWRNPRDLAIPEVHNIDIVYNFVLEHGYALEIAGVPVVTLGPSIAPDQIPHDYYDSDKVVDDLKQLKGWHTDHGHVRVLPEAMGRGARDPVTNRVGPSLVQSEIFPIP